MSNISLPSIVPSYNNTIVAKANSGATRHYWHEQDIAALRNIQHLTHGPHVKLPNNEQLRARINGTLDLHSDLSSKVSLAHVLPKLTNSSLPSLGQLCNNNYISLLHKDFLKVLKNNKVVVSGICN
eukprot:15328823-Ditylum_brightwellii.AAC.2